MTTKADVERIAHRAAEVHEQDGLSRAIINAVTFNLTERGWCSKFVRQCHHAAMGIEWPGWAGRFATWTERNLTQQGFAREQPELGDIVCFNAVTYQRHGRHNVWGWPAWKVKANNAVGHIGIVVRGEQVAENTSSTVRGPGTVLSPLAPFASRISGYYSPLPSAALDPYPAEALVVLLPGHENTAPAHLRDGHYEMTVRAAAEMFGCDLLDHELEEQGKLYLRRQP